MKKLFIFSVIILLVATCVSGYSQSISATDRKNLSIREDSLQRFSDSMINAEYNAKRFLADSNFVRTLVRALKIKNSFYYPFDSLQTISRLYSPDSTFRIFTWQLKK